MVENNLERVLTQNNYLKSNSSNVEIDLNLLFSDNSYKIMITHICAIYDSKYRFKSHFRRTIPIRVFNSIYEDNTINFNLAKYSPNSDLDFSHQRGSILIDLNKPDIESLKKGRVRNIFVGLISNDENHSKIAPIEYYMAKREQIKKITHH